MLFYFIFSRRRRQLFGTVLQRLNQNIYYSMKYERGFFRVPKQIYSSYFIFSRRRRLRFQLLFILKDECELENIFHVGSRSLNIRL